MAQDGNHFCLHYPLQPDTSGRAKVDVSFHLAEKPQDRANFMLELQLTGTDGKEIGHPTHTQPFHLLCRHNRKDVATTEKCCQPLTYTPGGVATIGWPTCVGGAIECGKGAKYVRFEVQINDLSHLTSDQGAKMRVTLVQSPSLEPYQTATLRYYKRTKEKLMSSPPHSVQLAGMIDMYDNADVELPARDGMHVSAIRRVLASSCANMKMMFGGSIPEGSGGKVRLLDESLPSQQALRTIVRALHSPGSALNCELSLGVLAEVIELARFLLLPGEQACPMETAVLELASDAFSCMALEAAEGSSVVSARGDSTGAAGGAPFLQSRQRHHVGLHHLHS